MRTMRIFRPCCKLPATTGSKNPFPSKVEIMLNTTAGNPRLANPSRNPLLLDTILHGPVFRNLAIPIPPLAIDVANVSINVVLSVSALDTARLKRT